MELVTGIVVYILVWWVVIFAVLPWGNRAPDDPMPGTVESAPVKPRIWTKVLITTGVAAVIWGIIDALIVSDLISFHEMAKGMAPH